MRFRLAVEEMEVGRYVCWVLDLLGCYSASGEREAAVRCAPERIAAHLEWLHRHDPSLPVIGALFETEVVENFEAFPSVEDPDYLVNAFFEDDLRPLTYWDCATGLQLLVWTREEFLGLVEKLSEEGLSAPIEGERRGTLAGIVEHVAGAENWYFGHLGLSVDWAKLPRDPLVKLRVVRENTRTQIAKLIDDARVVESFEERWSARKILRRTLWHERAHTEQILRLTS